jgi:Ala-tRNA(Pro) deacylase
VTHSPAYTAQEIAALAHIPGKEMAKTVVIKVDGETAMAVLPASFRINIEQLRQAIGARSCELAGESEFESMFPDCELGAMPPFGNLYGMKVYVAAKLSENDQIAFNACSHSELIRMEYGDFERLAEAKVLRFSID